MTVTGLVCLCRKYKEIFNSDSEKFGGQGVVNARAKAAIHMECDNRSFL